MGNDKKHITFRLDAGGIIGLGHYYRSISLAHRLLKDGWEVDFLHNPSDFWDTHYSSVTNHYNLPDLNQEEFILQFCKDNNSKYFYVDGSIDFDKRFIDSLKKNGVRIVFYQNLSNSRHLSDIYILPSIHQGDSFFSSFNHKVTKVYQGLQYFTFNEKLFDLTHKPIKILQNVDSIAITVGGSDPKSLLLRLYDMLDFEKFSHVNFNFYYGENYQHKALIPKKLKLNAFFLEYNIADILENDLVISAFGVSSYEMMSLGMPVIGIGHQESNANALRALAKKTNSIIDLGLIDDLTSEKLNSELVKVNSDTEILYLKATNALKNIDRKGVDRVAFVLNNSF